MTIRREWSIAGLIALLAAILAAFAPAFFAAANLRDMAMATVPVAMTALGAMLVILTGHIDISIGSQFAACSVAAALLAKLGLPLPAAAAGAAMLGAGFGAVNGLLVARAGIPSIVVTLAAMVALRDALRWTTEGAWVQDLPRNFQWFGWSRDSSDAFALAVTALLGAAAAWGLRNLRAGRAVYATGSCEEAARILGIPTRTVVFSVFAIAGALTGTAAFLNAVRFHQVPSNSGVGLELQAIAAVIVGGTSITGGRGTIAGTLLGVVLLAMTGPALSFLGVSAYWERAIHGSIILGAAIVWRKTPSSAAAIA